MDIKTGSPSKAIAELERKQATCKEPHAIATDGTTLWVSSRATWLVDIIDPKEWRKTGELAPPAMAWGMTFANGDLIMTCGDFDTEDRRVVKFRGGMQAGMPIVCPEGTGSHLSFDGEHILLGQWYLKRVNVLGDDGSVIRTYEAPHEVCGIAVKDGLIYALGTDDENTDEYFISSIDIATGASREIAMVPFKARGLAWDGQSFWTNHREKDQTVRFSLPD
jgi:hypothetical protein